MNVLYYLIMYAKSFYFWFHCLKKNKKKREKKRKRKKEKAQGYALVFSNTVYICKYAVYMNV